MDLLLDTHAFIWFAENNKSLTLKAKKKLLKIQITLLLLALHHYGKLLSKSV